MTREKIESYFGPEWVDFMVGFMQSEEWTKIEDELKRLTKEKIPFTPGVSSMFRCFKELPLSKVKVVLIGQDPYPTSGGSPVSKPYANGLAFSHAKDLKIAPSLQMIIDAVEADCYNGLNFDKPGFNTELTQWVEQGVLLLNTALTVPLPVGEQKVSDVAGKHADLWKPFTEYVLKQFGAITRDKIFLAWGAKAQEFTKSISVFNHFVFMHEHPAAAAREKRAWVCKHFSTTNACIIANKLGDTIKW